MMSLNTINILFRGNITIILAKMIMKELDPKYFIEKGNNV